MPLCPQIPNDPEDITPTFDITSTVKTSTTVTYTASGHTYAAGDTVIVDGIAPDGYNGTFVITSVVAGTSFTCANTTNQVITDGVGNVYQVTTDYDSTTDDALYKPDSEDVDEIVTVSVSGKNKTYYQNDPPATAVIGDVWFDMNDNNKMYRWDGTTWVSVQDLGIPAVEAAVNGKNKIFRQTTPPTATAIGDIWFDTDDSNKQYSWDGSGWVSVRDAGIQAGIDAAAAAASAATAAQSTADGKNKVFRQSTAPTANAVGDLWFDTSSDNKPNRWNGSAWEAYGFGNLAIGNLDASKISTGYLAADRIEAASLNATKLVAGSITATQIAAETITAAKIAIGTITADQIASATITAAEIAANTITAAEILAGSITVDRLQAGTLTGFTIRTSSGAGRVELNSSTESLRVLYSSVVRGHILAASAGTPGIIMHAGSTPNSGATTYGMVFLQPSYALLAASSANYVQVDTTTGVTISGNLYSLTNFFNQDSTTTTNAANTWMSATNGLTRRSTASSQRYKENITDIRTVGDLDPKKLLDLPVRAFTYKPEFLTDADDRAGMMIPGFIAEEVDQVYPIAADYVDGPESWNDRMITPALLALIQDLNKRIELLEGK
jgi:hypothetical protein